MLFLRLMLLMIGFSLLASAAALVLYDIYLALELKRLLPKGIGRADSNLPAEVNASVTTARSQMSTVHWQAAGRLSILAVVLILSGKSIVVVPDGHSRSHQPNFRRASWNSVCRHA